MSDSLSPRINLITVALLSIFGFGYYFVSATLILQASYDLNSNVNSLMISSMFWSVLFYVLGAVLLISGFLFFTRYAISKPRIMCGLMLFNGILALASGIIMLVGISPMPEGTSKYAIILLVSGFVMIVYQLFLFFKVNN